MGYSVAYVQTYIAIKTSIAYKISGLHAQVSGYRCIDVVCIIWNYKH